MSHLLLVATVFIALAQAAPSNQRALARKHDIPGRVRTKRQIESPREKAYEEELQDELSRLSDTQLEYLAAVVQAELDRYDPQVEEYQIVEIPDEYLFDVPEEIHPRDRRSMPVQDYEEAEIIQEQPELIVVPEEVLEEAILEEIAEEKANEELELGLRIAEMASLLNERASRGRR